MFAEWRVFTGLRKSGQDEGKPVRLVRMGNNSACLITEREQGMAEEDRRIAGVFLADETFVGKLCDDGYIWHPTTGCAFLKKNLRGSSSGTTTATKDIP